MAINNQSDPEAVKRLREKVEGRKQSDPDAVQRLREKVLKENPDYKPSTPSSRGGAMSGSAGPMILGAEIAKDPVKYEVPLLEKRIIEESAYKPKKSRKPDSNQVSQGWSRASQYMPKSDYDAMVTRTISDADAARDENDEHIINTVIYKNKYSSVYPQYIGKLNDEEFDRVYNEHFSSERPDSEGEAFIYDTKSTALKEERLRRVKTPYDNAVSFLDQFTPDKGQEKDQNTDNIVLGKNLADQLEVNVTSTDTPKRQREEDLDDNIVPLADNPFDGFVEFLTDKDTKPEHTLDWDDEETPSELDELLRKESAPGADGVEYSRDDIYKNTFDFNKDVFATPEDKHYISTEERGKIINPEDVTDALGDLADRKDIVGAMPMDTFEDRFKTADQFDKTSGIYRDLYPQKYSYELEKLSDEELDELIENNGHLDVIEHEFTPNQDSTEKYLKEVKHLTPREVEYSRNVITTYNKLPQREQAVLLSGASDTAKINRLISLGYDKETAERVVDYSSILVNEQEHQKMVKDIEDAGFLKLEGYNAAAFLTNLLSFVGQADLTYQAKRNLFSDTFRPVDYYTPLTAPGRFARETRKEKTERIDNEFLRNAYGLGTSMLDSALTMPLALLGPLGAGTSRVIMSGSAGLNAVYDAKERGASDYTAVNYGIAASISEAMFESISIGSFVDIFKKDAVESVLKKLVVQGFVEGSEETMTSLANAWADEIINGDKSEFNDNVKKYIEAGKSEEEAHRLALDNYIASLGIDFVGGFISGGIFGSAGSAINNAIQKHDKKRYVNDLNKITEKVGNLPGNEDLQLKPLTNNASEKEIESRKKEISDAIKTAENAVKTAETEASSVPLAERLDAMSEKNEAISVEDAKKATGFGDNGAKMVADLANTEGVTFSQAKSTVEVAYLAGFSDVDSSKVSFVTDTQIDAFTAGKLDRMMQDTTAKAEAANLAKIFDNTIVDTVDKTSAKGYNVGVNSKTKTAARIRAEEYVADLDELRELGVKTTYDRMLAQLEHGGLAQSKGTFGEVFYIQKKSNGKYVAIVEGEGSGGFVPNELNKECDSFEEAYISCFEYIYNRDPYSYGITTNESQATDTNEVSVKNLKNQPTTANQEDRYEGKASNATNGNIQEIKGSERSEITDEFVSPEYETLETRKPIVATDFQADKKRRADAAKQYGLSNDEARKLENYVRGTMCYVLNERMLKGTLADGDLNVVNSIRNALLKMPEYSGRTYRNLQFKTKKEYNDFLSEYSEDNTVELKAFTSTSKLPNGYPKIGECVVHLVFDGVSGRDIADTFGLPRQQEVVYLPGTAIKIKKVMIANDGNPLIFVQEVTSNENIRGKETGSSLNNRPTSSLHQNIDGQGVVSNGNGRNLSSVHGETRSGYGRDVLLSERGKSADPGNVLGEHRGINETDLFNETEDTDELAMWTTKRVGDEVKPKSISEIVATIQHDFGINITTGHIRGSALGTYTVDNKGIKTKITNNLPVISHELGHYFERTLGIKSKLTNDLMNELTSQLDPKFAERYTDEQLVRESIAEYVRRFLQNRETAAIDYPKFNDFFLKLLSSKDLAKIEQLADDINAYYSLDVDTATSSIRLREEGSFDLRTPMEKLQDIGDGLYQAWVDINNSIKRFDRATGSNAYIYASNAAYSDAIAGQIITGDLTDKNGQYVASGLKTVLNGIDLNTKHIEYKDFGEYLIVKHGPERLKEGMRVFADDRKNSSAWMASRQTQLEDQYPHFKDASERLYTFIKQFYRTWGVDTGLISEEMLKSWESRWEYYVPFNRVMEDGKGNGGAKRGFANQTSTIKKARGSGRDIQHPVDNVIANIVKMVNAGTRNNVMTVITDYAERLGANALFLEKVPMAVTATPVDMTGVKDKLTTWLGESDMESESKKQAVEIVGTLDNVMVQYGRGKVGGDVVTVLKDGNPEAWKINDPGLLQSLTNLSPKTMDGVLDAVAVVSRFITSNITGNNIVWSIFSNLPKDAGTFFTYSENKNVAKLAKGVGSAYLNKFKGDKADPLYKEFLAMGGGKTSAYTSDRNLTKKVRKKLAGRNIELNPIEWIGFVSDTVESGPRFATYKLMRQAGMSPHEAFYEAMDITVNFRRGGYISREINKGVPFFNATVQGLDKFARWITVEKLAGMPGRKKAIAARTTAYIAVNAAIQAIFYALNNSNEEDEENYEQLSTYTKNNYWLIPIGDGKYFGIPKPREHGVLSSFFGACLEYGVGENDHAFDGFYDYATDNFLPSIASDIAQLPTKGFVEAGAGAVGSLAFVGPIAYLAANRDFLGRPIVSSGLQNLEPKDQYTDRTSKIAYWVGQAFGGSPAQIDYFFEQILGGWWKYQKALFPLGEKNRDWTLGVKNTYIKDNQYSTDLTNWLYDRADATKRAKNSNPTDIDKAIAAKWDSNMTRFYGTYYKKAKADSTSTAARGTRQLVLDMIKEYQKGIDNNYKTSTQKAVEAVCKSMNSTEFLPSVMPGTIKDGDEKEHNLSDVQYVEYQTDYLRLYWEIVEDTMTNDMSTSKKAYILVSAKKVAREQATERTLGRIGATHTDFATKYKGVENDDLTKFFAGKSKADEDGSLKKKEVVDVIDNLNVDDDDVWTLYFSCYDSKGAKYAHDNGIKGNTYLDFLEALNDVDEPNKSGEYGTYTTPEVNAAIKMLESLTKKEKTILRNSILDPK